MNKVVKNVLTAVGAIAVVKTAPVLALGAVIGAVASNPEKVAKAAEDLVGRVEAELAKYGVDVHAEEECECCNGGECDCENECCCDCKDEPDQVSEDAEAPVEEAEPAISVSEVNDETDVTEDDEDDLTPTEAGNWSAT